MRKKFFVVICVVACLGLFAGNASAGTAIGTIERIVYDATGVKVRVDTGSTIRGGYVDSGTDEKAVLACALTAQAGGLTVKLTFQSGLITGITLFTVAP